MEQKESNINELGENNSFENQPLNTVNTWSLQEYNQEDVETLENFNKRSSNNSNMEQNQILQNQEMYWESVDYKNNKSNDQYDPSYINPSYISKKEETPLQKNMISNYVFYLLLSFFFGLFFLTCFYDNYDGIGLSILVFGGYGFYFLALQKLEIKIKKASYPYMIGSMILGLSIIFTNSSFINFFDKVGIVVLSGIFLVKQLYEDKTWGFGQYLKNGVLFMAQIFRTIYYPISNLMKFLKKKNNQTKENSVKYVVYGILISIPLLIILFPLLLSSDKWFSNIFEGLVSWIYYFPNFIGVVFVFFVGFLGFYGSLSALSLERLEKQQVEKPKYHSTIAITFNFIISMLYTIFCILQIIQMVQVSLGKQSIIYSEFARSGFFELLFVCAINFIIVMFSCNRYEDTKILKGILTYISVCTYIMIGSSAYKMLLYISVYHLTLDRILVLLGLLFFLFFMAGLLIYIYKRQFPIFKYVLLVGMLIYILFSFSKPDKIIANYNVEHLRNSLTVDEDIRYLTQNLSLDAIPTIETMDVSALSKNEKELIRERMVEVVNHEKKNTIRTYNFSRGRALKTAKQYLQRVEEK